MKLKKTKIEKKGNSNFQFMKRASRMAYKKRKKKQQQQQQRPKRRTNGELSTGMEWANSTVHVQ